MRFSLDDDDDDDDDDSTYPIGARREDEEATIGGPKYQPSTKNDDPIVQALQKVLGVKTVESKFFCPTVFIIISHCSLSLVSSFLSRRSPSMQSSNCLTRDGMAMKFSSIPLTKVCTLSN